MTDTSPPLGFEAIAAAVAKVLTKHGEGEALRTAKNFEDNLGWSKTKLMERAQALHAGAPAPERKPLSALPPNSGWVNLWRIRDGEWQSFIGRIADDGAVEYPHGGRSLHNTVTHWTPLGPGEAPAA